VAKDKYICIGIYLLIVPRYHILCKIIVMKKLIVVVKLIVDVRLIVDVYHHSSHCLECLFVLSESLPS